MSKWKDFVSGGLSMLGSVIFVLAICSVFVSTEGLALAAVALFIFLIGGLRAIEDSP